jgi:hypothetical protein
MTQTTPATRTAATSSTTANDGPTISRAARRTGLVLSAAMVLFLLFDSITKLIAVSSVTEASAAMGFPAATVPVIGGVLLVCLVLYVVPRTAVLGAVLLTGYLGGAVCAQLRIEAPLWSNLLFPVYVGIVVWVGLYLRSAALRSLVRAGS